MTQTQNGALDPGESDRGCPRRDGVLAFAWLEITGRCQLRCVHCYADSGPTGSHGTMSVRDWQRVIDDVTTVGARSIQFIGGEPTTHPSFVQLVEHASLTGLEVEIFSNLLDIRPEWWDLFSRRGVTLATSYYSDQSAEHEEIT
ncbi:MAG TPA: radical SAM protein, partial [Actinomycetota bacterium]